MSTVKTNNVQIGQSVTATNNFTWYQPATPDGTVRLGNGNSGSVTDLVTLTSAGNLGIGTSSPGAKLQVQGNFSANTGIGFTLNAASSGANSKTQYTDGVTYNWTSGTTGNAFTWSTGEYGTTTGTERMRLDSSGNLGLGVTPSAWGGFKVIQINNGGFASFLSGSNIQTAVLSNSYFDGGVYRFIASAQATYYNQNNGSHQWYNSNNTSGTAGATFTPTQAMTLDASGNLLVGTTSGSSGGDAASDKVIVQRDVAASGAWAVRSIVRNATANKAVFTGVFSTYPGVFAHNGTLSAWNDLYLNSVAGAGGGNVYVNLGTGTLYTNGGMLTNTNPSDARLKEDITPISYGLAEINKLKPVTFKFKNDPEGLKQIRWGFIAQDVKPIMPELVTTFTHNDEEYLGLEQNGVYTILVKAIQELSAELNELKAKVNA